MGGWVICVFLVGVLGVYGCQFARSKMVEEDLGQREELGTRKTKRDGVARFGGKGYTKAGIKAAALDSLAIILYVLDTRITV